jgi:DNA polymerase-3 subunit epsilon
MILSIGSFAVIDNSIVIGDSFEVLLQYKFLHDNGLSMIWVESKMKNYRRRGHNFFNEFIGNSVLVEVILTLM